MTLVSKIITFLSITVLLIGCKAGEHYLNRHQQLKTIVITPDSTLSPVVHWWELYQDSTLKSLIDTALLRNRDLQIASATIKEVQAIYRVEQSELFPKLGLKAEYEKKRGGAADGTSEAMGTFAWEVDLWGKLRWAKTAALNSYLNTIEGRKAVETTVIAEVAQAYFELRALDKEITIVKQTLEARQKGIDLALLRYRGGLTSEIAYKQAQVEYARTATLIPQLEQTIRVKENTLALLLGHRPDSKKRDWLQSEQLLELQIPSDLTASLVLRRPDMLIAERDLQIAYAKAGVAYASLFPSLTLTGSLGIESNDLQSFLRSPHWTIGGALVTPLLQMGKNRAKLKAAEAGYEKEIYRYQKSVLVALKEVSNAITAANKAIEIVTLRNNLERQASAYLQSAELQYINGVISYLDVLDAQRGYFDAQIALNSALRDRELTVVALYKALGGGWKR